MKKSEIKPIFILTIIAILILAVILIARNNNAKKNAQNAQANTTEENTVEEKYVQVLNDGTKLNDSEKLNKDRSFEGQSDIELSNIQLTSKDGITNLLCDVKNNSSTPLKLQEVYVILRDENGNEIDRIPSILEDIQPGETKQFSTFVTADYANAYDFTMIKK